MMGFRLPIGSRKLPTLRPILAAHLPRLRRSRPKGRYATKVGQLDSPESPSLTYYANLGLKDVAYEY